MTNNALAVPLAEEFFLTREYWRFVEFCESCRRNRYIGLCYGIPGVGKTQSARQYARADWVPTQLPYRMTPSPTPTLPLVGAHATVFYHPPTTNSPRQILHDVTKLRVLRQALPRWDSPDGGGDPTELLIVDEVDRLKMTALEQLREIYDRKQLGLILIGMPGIEKRMARYAQLYSRVGFVHAFRPLDREATHAVIARLWQQRAMPGQSDDADHADAVAMLIRQTDGKFRLIQRFFTQIKRILQVNPQVTTVTKEVVEAAREILVIGAD